jgi:hypothetical protein
MLQYSASFLYKKRTYLRRKMSAAPKIKIIQKLGRFKGLENGGNKRIIIWQVKNLQVQMQSTKFRAAFKCNVSAAKSQSKTGNLHFCASCALRSFLRGAKKPNSKKQ